MVEKKKNVVAQKVFLVLSSAILSNLQYILKVLKVVNNLMDPACNTLY